MCNTKSVALVTIYLFQLLIIKRTYLVIIGASTINRNISTSSKTYSAMSAKHKWPGELINEDDRNKITKNDNEKDTPNLTLSIHTNIKQARSSGESSRNTKCKNLGYDYPTPPTYNSEEQSQRNVWQHQKVGLWLVRSCQLPMWQRTVCSPRGGSHLLRHC